MKRSKHYQQGHRDGYTKGSTRANQGKTDRQRQQYAEGYEAGVAKYCRDNDI